MLYSTILIRPDIDKAIYNFNLGSMRFAIVIIVYSVYSLHLRYI